MSPPSPPPYTPPTPPSSASPTYNALHTTALAFLSAQTLDATLPTRMNFSLLKSLCTPSFSHSFGHNYAVSLTPHLQGHFSFDAFVAHLSSMLPRLAAWDARVTHVLVDEARMEVMLRISFFMRAKGVPEDEESEDVVENDIVWMLGFEASEEGEVGMKVCKSVEFVDGVAAGKLKEVMMRRGAAGA
jgi:hypothetical protein